MTQFEYDKQCYNEYMKKAAIMGCKDRYSVSDVQQKIILLEAHPDVNGVYVIQPFVSGISRACFENVGRYLKVINKNNRLRSMWAMFYGLADLEELDLSEFTTDGVENMAAMFGMCSKLKSLDLSTFDTSQVQSFEGMFAACKALEQINVMSFITKNAVTMQAMFNGCASLRSINVSTFNTSRVVSMNYMFANCKTIEKLDLRNFDTRKTAEMDSMFYNCSNLLVLIMDICVHKETDITYKNCKATNFIAKSPKIRYIYCRNPKVESWVSSSLGSKYRLTVHLFTHIRATIYLLLQDYKLTMRALSRLLWCEDNVIRQILEGKHIPSTKEIVTLFSVTDDTEMFRKTLEKNKQQITEKQYKTCLAALQRKEQDKQ